MTLLLRQSNTMALRHISKVRVSFALRAGAHSAKSVCRFAAQSAANRASLDSLPFGEKKTAHRRSVLQGVKVQLVFPSLVAVRFRFISTWSVANERASIGVQSKHTSSKPKTKEHLLQLHGFRFGQRRVELAKFVALAECWLTHRSTGPIAACG